MTALTLVPLLAQFLVAPDSRSMETVQKIFARQPAEPLLSCKFEVLSPRLGFSLVHWSGFNLSVPARQFPVTGASREVALAIEITPKLGKPIYLGDRFAVPKPPDGKTYPKDAALSYMGGFYIGPGEYRVRVFAADSRNHECGKQWDIKVKPGKIAPRMEPGQITAVGDERWRGLTTEGPPNRLTVILQVAPFLPRRNMVRVSSYDRSVLMTSLTTLLDTVKATAATVIAVDPRNRKIIFNTSNFTPRERFRLAREMAAVNLGVVSLDTLKGPNASEFMESVLTAAQEPAAKSDAVVFLGPAFGWYGRLTPRMKEIAKTLPRPHFLGLTRIAGLPDGLVAQVVKSADGEVKQLFSPDDFAKAIAKVGR